MVAPAQGNISRIEYFFDSSDPGLGTAPTLAFSPVNSGTVTTQQGVSVPQSLSAGEHKLTARAQTTLGIWSTTKATSFSVAACVPPLVTLAGNLTATAGQPVSFSVGLGGSPPFSLTANGQVQTNILTNTAFVALTLTTPGTYTLTPQSLSMAVSNGCGPGLTSGQISTTVQPGCNPPIVYFTGNQTVTAGQSVTVALSMLGTGPYSVTANGRVTTNLTGNPIYVVCQFSTPGTFKLLNNPSPDLADFAVANACGALAYFRDFGSITVLPGPACTVMQTVKAGNWDDPTVWSCGRVPILTDAVLIRHAVTVPGGFVAHAQKISFEVGGKLSWGISARLQLGL